MTAAQSKRIADLLKKLQDVRRGLDKESAGGMTGIGANFGTEVDMNDAIWGVIYAEKALARIWDREGYVRGLPEKTREMIRVKPTNVTRQ